MTDFDWRTWVYATMIAHAPLIALVPAIRIFGAGGVEGSEAPRPFIVIRFGVDTPFGHGKKRTMDLWVHDTPGDFMRIDAIVEVLKDLFRNRRVVGANAIQTEWTGDSQDLADDGYGTIVRTTSFALVGTLQEVNL